MLSVHSALSGELLTVVDDFEGKTANAKEVKELLVAQIGARFQQRFLSEDGSGWWSEPPKVRLVLEWCPPDIEDRMLTDASRDNDDRWHWKSCFNALATPM